MDFFGKLLAGSRDGQVAPALLNQLEGLLSEARRERQQMQTMLASLNGDDGAVPRALARLEQRASALAEQLDAVSVRAEDLGRSAADADALQARVTSLEASLAAAEDRAGQTLDRAAELLENSTAIQDLVSVARSTLGQLEAVRADPQIADLTDRLPDLRQDCARIAGQQDLIAARLEELQAATACLTETATAAGEISKRADEHAGGTAARLESLEQKLQEILQCEAITSNTSAQLRTLNALAEHVMVKVKALEGQQQTVERALVDSRRVGEMVWETNARIERLREGSGLTAEIEGTLGRLERLHQDTVGQAERATRDHEQFSEAVERQRQKSALVLQTLQTQLDRLALNRSELDTVLERLAAAQDRLTDTERRIDGLSATDQTLSEFSRKLDGFGARTADLRAQVNAIEDKQPLLTALQSRLDEVDAETRRAAVQVEALARRRQELVDLKSEFDACEATYASARTLRDELQEQTHQFAALAERAREFMQGVPAIEAAIGDLNTRVTDTAARADAAVSMRPGLEEVAGWLDSLTPRFGMLDDLQARLNRLHELSTDIDGRLAAQLSRQEDLDRIRVTCDGLATQLDDAQQKLALVESARARLEALPADIGELQASITSARQDVAALRLDQDGIASQERRLAELKDAAAMLLAGIAARTETLQGVHADLGRAASLKDELFEELSRISTLERETCERHLETQSLLDQATARWRAFDERRPDLVLLERSMERLDGRIETLTRLADEVDAKILSLGDRERIVEAVKQELELIHEAARTCQADLAAIGDQRAAIQDGRADVDRLMQVLAATDEKLGEVERRGGAVEEVGRKADAVGRLLDDIRVSLETVAEQKALIDHVTELLARFDDATAEARNTIKSLRAERKLAQRIVEHVRDIHARAGSDIRPESG